MDKNGRRNIRLFNNLEVAKIVAKLYYPDCTYEYYFKVDNILIKRSLCQKISDRKYQVFANNIQYDIEELYTYRITDIGYIVFENADTQRYNTKDAIPKMIEYYNNIEDITTNILLDNLECGIEYINASKHEIVLKIKNTSARIHILQNSKLMDINQDRKNKNQRALPFDKAMDKFLTFYVYISKDYSEPIKNDGDTKSQTVLEYILSDLKDLYKENQEANPRYITIGCNKNFKMEDLQ